MKASSTALPNSQAEIKKRMANGKITWIGPLVMLSSRTVIGLIVLVLVVTIFFRRSADPWAEAFLWWRVYGTLVGIGCLIPLFFLVRREGLRILDLGNYSQSAWLRDVLIGVGIFFPYMLLASGPVVGMVILQHPAPEATEQLPLWAAFITIVIWPIVWAFSEDNTYLGYSLPRVEALNGGRKWIAVLAVWFFLSLQHVFFPFAGLDWQILVSWFIGLIPAAIFYCWLWWRLRRLLPITVAHVLADAATVFVSLYFLG
jgi:membrane protease YdiL (CAAX protease family)